MPIAYSNPVYRGYFADPFVLQHRGVYWAYGTGAGPQPDGRWFPVLRSDDFVHWRHVGGALPPLAPEGGAAFTDYWAPEVAERDGLFHLYYSAGTDGRDETHRLRVAIADRPEGPFGDAGRVEIGGALGDAFSIDASPFRDPADGRWYLFFATDFFGEGRVGTGIVAVELAPDMRSAASEPVTILRPAVDWQIYERNRVHYGGLWEAWHTVEGPFVWFHDGLYYCFYSGGNWQSAAYGVGFAVADKPLGPYRDSWNAEGPAVLRGVEGEILGPGHNSVALGPDGRTEFLVYHAWDKGRTARRMFVDPLVWVTDTSGFDHPRCEGPTMGPREI